MKEHAVFKKSTQYQIERILNVFDKISDNMINIFLCGGASDKNQISYRDELNQYFNSQIYSNVRIFYPEDLFVSLLNSDKSQNMLELENFLVANSDIVCIVAESVGSFVELGAFVNSDKTRQKVVALVEEQFKRAKSFLMLGPIDLLTKEDKSKVIYYTKLDVQKSASEIIKFARKNTYKGKGLKINTIVGLAHYISLLLFFYNELNIEQLDKYVQFSLRKENLDFKVKKDDILLRSALKLLFKEKKIIKDVNRYYYLSKKGLEDIRVLLGLEVNSVKRYYNAPRIYNNDVKLYDEIKFDIMRDKYYNNKTSSH